MRRRLNGLLLAMVLTALALALIGGPAGAQPRQGLKVVDGTAAERSYPPIPGNYPVAPTVNWTPGGCNDSAIGNVCDTIPLEIVIPDLGPVDDFYVTIQVSWDDPEGLNDLDIYLWDDEQLRKSQGSTGWTRMNQAATSSNPETIKQFSPTLGKYNLTVVNWSGPNLGYTVKAFITVAEFDEPFESLAPTFTPTDSSTPTAAPAPPPPFDFSAVDPVTPGPAAPTFGELPVQPDAELDFGPSDFEQNLAAPPPLIDTSGVAFRDRPPRAVPGIVAAFWLGVVPTLLVVASAVLLARRRRDSFAYA